MALGNDSTHTVTINAGSLTFGNVATTTVPSSNANAWTLATTTTTSLLKFNSTATRFGVSSSTPSATFSVGGDVALGNDSTHTVTMNGGTLAFGNVSTTTIPTGNANAWNIATSSANIPLMKFDTSNYRVGIGTSSPAALFSVGGNAIGSRGFYVSSTGNVGIGTTSPGASIEILTGNISVSGGCVRSATTTASALFGTCADLAENYQVGERVTPGDILMVNSGDKIPVDGIVISGYALVDESMITGESIPSEKSLDDKIIGGTIAVNGNIKMKAEQVGKQTVLSKIIELVKTATSLFT